MTQHRQIRLDAARGVAILFVLLFHFRHSVGWPILDRVVAPVFAIGWAGVDLFFVLSGFLVGRLIFAELAATGALDRRRFLLRRAWRLWPVLWLFLAAMLLLGGAGQWRSIWPVLLHLQNFDDRAPSHLWSLAVEEHFYLGAALVLPVFWRVGGARLVGAGLAATVAASMVCRLIASNAGASALELQWHTQYRLDAPALGVLLALLAARRPALFTRLSGAQAIWLGTGASGFVLIAAAQAAGWSQAALLTPAALASVAAILGCVGQGQAAAGATRWFAALGTISYPLYIWHASIGLTSRAVALGAGAGEGTAMLVSLLASIVTAALIHRTIERPTLRWREYRPAAKPAETLTPAASCY